jgi:hypothetical protein
MKRPHVRLVVNNAERIAAGAFFEPRLKIQRVRYWTRQALHGFALTVALIADCAHGLGHFLRALWKVFAFPFIAIAAVVRFFARITIGVFVFYWYLTLAACGVGICFLIGYMALQFFRITAGH